VKQRLRLREKGRAPDTLVMTATPIPRTLALMLYADLDVSALDEMPPGRKKVVTRFINSSKRDAAYDFAEKEIEAGRQVYVVAPAIGDRSDEGDSDGHDGQGGTDGQGGPGGTDGQGGPDGQGEPVGQRDQFGPNGQDDEGYGIGIAESGDSAGIPLASALELTEELKERFPGRRVAVMYGKMSSDAKEETMRAFVSGEIDLLVSTVVIEVGVNVPNATMMIVENAERFGLAQLHQLRGRVGRGSEKSYCVLISDSKSELANSRLETLAQEHDGFRIAELDLTLRGPGDLFGVRQHGLPDLKIADPARHMEILTKANNDAKALLYSDPELAQPGNILMRRFLNKLKDNE
jgi:ATP-dependent DNA helicase RecG